MRDIFGLESSLGVGKGALKTYFLAELMQQGLVQLIYAEP